MVRKKPSPYPSPFAKGEGTKVTAPRQSVATGLALISQKARDTSV